MTQPVSVVIPCLDDRDLLEKNLPPLLEELENRALGDDVLVVDDTGEAVLAEWLAEHFPSVVCHSRKENGGFAVALLDGVKRAKHELVFSMNPDVLVHRGFMDPLVACIEDPDVHSVTPRVLLNGDEETVESVTEIFMRHGIGEVRQQGLEGKAEHFTTQPIPVAYGIGGTLLMRRDEFVSSGGFDPIYEPFYWEDVDLGWMGWRSGRQVLYQPASVVEHHHRGTIGSRVPKDLVRAVIEKNRLLFQWKVMDTPEVLEKHVAALYRLAVDAWLGDQREELIWLTLALDQLKQVIKTRKSLPSAARDFEEIRRATSHELP